MSFSELVDKRIQSGLSKYQKAINLMEKNAEIESQKNKDRVISVEPEIEEDVK